MVARTWKDARCRAYHERMLRIELGGCQIQVLKGTTPAGSLKLLRLTDPQSGIVVDVPFDPDGQKAFEQAWHGLVVVQPENGSGLL